MKWNEVYPNWLSGVSFFTNIGDWVPWPNTDSYNQSLGWMYFGTHSGEKTVAPVIDAAVASEQWKDNLSSLIQRMLQAKYSQKWKRLWDTMNLEYDPMNIYNVTMEATRKQTFDGTKTFDDTKTQTGGSTYTETRDLATENTGNTTNTETRNTNNTSVNYSFGFNSENTDKDKSSESEGTEGGSIVNNNELNTKQSYTGTDKQEEDLNRKDVTNAVTDTHDVEDETETVTKKGNLGHITVQSILEQEITLRQWEFFENVFQDIDKLLTIPYYAH